MSRDGKPSLELDAISGRRLTTSSALPRCDVDLVVLTSDCTWLEYDISFHNLSVRTNGFTQCFKKR